MSKKERGLTKEPSGNTHCHTVILKLHYSNAVAMPRLIVFPVYRFKVIISFYPRSLYVS